jgi:hypothetical protein
MESDLVGHVRGAWRPLMSSDFGYLLRMLTSLTPFGVAVDELDVSRPLAHEISAQIADNRVTQHRRMPYRYDSDRRVMRRTTLRGTERP